MINPIDPVKREWLKEKRLELGLTTREIAVKFGISFQHYNDIETGRRNPSIELSFELAKFFDVPLEKLLVKRTKFNKSEDK